MLLVAVGMVALALSPVGAAQWQTQELLTTFAPGGPESSGVNLEVHPTTGSWVAVVGEAENSITAKVHVFRSGNGGETWTGAVVSTLQDTHIALTSPQGLTTSLTGMAFCLTKVNDDDGVNPITTTVELHQLEPSGIHAGLHVVTGNLVWNAPCSMALPRNGWTPPPAVGMIYVSDPEDSQDNQTRAFVLSERVFETSGTTHLGPYLLGGNLTLIDKGPFRLAGEFQVGADAYSVPAIGGTSYERPHRLDETVSIFDTSCSNRGGFWAFAGCVGKKFLQGAAWSVTLGCGLGLLGEGFLRGCGDEGGFREPVHRSNTRTAPIADEYHLFVAAGYSDEPVPSYQVNVGIHSYLNPGTIGGTTIASRPGLSLRAADVAAMGHYGGIVLYHDMDQDEIRSIKVSDEHVGAPTTAFAYEREVMHLRVKAIGTETDRMELVGAFVDRDGVVWVFTSRDRGNTWQTEQVANDAYTAVNTTFADNQSPIDVAYDETREKLLVIYANASSIVLMERDHNRTRPEIRAGAFEMHLGAAPSNEVSLTNVVAQGLGMTREGAAFLLAVMIIMLISMMVAAWSANGALAALGGAGAGAIAAMALGLMHFLLIIPIAVFYMAVKATVRSKA